VGGDWPGPPDATTEFPQRLVVDYVRVYADAEHLLRRPQQAAPTLPAKRLSEPLP